MTCEHCRQQLLPYLYDLLEPRERELADAHVEACPDCRAALLLAREQQGLLAEAVKADQSDIVFKAPAKAVPSALAPTVAMQAPPRRSYLLNRWTLAASILLVFFGGSAIAGWNLWRGHVREVELAQLKLTNIKQDIANTNSKIDGKKGENKKEIEAIQKEIDNLLNVWKEKSRSNNKEIQGAQVLFKGPQVAQAGARNRYEVEIVRNFEVAPPGVAQPKDKQGPPPQPQPRGEPPSVQVRAINQRTQKPVFEQQLQLQPNNRATFDLPPKLRDVEPGDDIAFEILMEAADGRMIKLTDNLKVAVPEYLTHLTTDRPLYRPGETVRFRSLTLDRFSFKPAEEKFHLRYRIVGPNNVEVYKQEVAAIVAGPNKEPIQGPMGEALQGVGAGEFALPEDLPLGQYTLHVGEVNDRFTEEKRTFLVNRWHAPRFQKELKFQRDTYNPRDQVKMNARVVPIKGAPAGGAINVTARLIVSGDPVWSERFPVDREGRVAFECELPKQLPKGTATIILECDDGVGPTEKLAREVPILVRNIQVDFYPEGGDLIADVQNRVYFQARTLADYPADIAGKIVSDKGDIVAHVQTESDDKEPGINQGMGVFSFVPENGRRYRLVVDAPAGIERTIALPAVKTGGVIMTTPQLVAENEIQVELMSVKERRALLVGAYCRGRLLAHQVVRAGAWQPVNVTLRPNVDAAGVYRITVFEMTGTPEEIVFNPVAERLVYRKSSARLDVMVTTDRPQYPPGAPVLLKLEALNEKKVRVPALAMVAVVDANVLKRADEKTARGMPTHFLLTNEVKSPEELENADVFLSDHPKAALALDLLLGTQGWRRFAEQNPQRFLERQNQQEARNPNFLANSVQVTQLVESDQKQIEQLDQRFVKSWMGIQKKLAATEMEEAGPAELYETLAAQQARLAHVEDEAARTAERAREMRVFLVQFGLGAAVLALLAIGFTLVRAGLRRLADGTGQPRRWLTAGLGLLAALFLISAIGVFALMGEKLFDDARRDDGGIKLGVNMGRNDWEGNAVQAPRADDLILAEPAEPDAAERPSPGDAKKAPVNIGPVNKFNVNAANFNAANNLQPPANLAGQNDEGNPNFNVADPQGEERRLRQQGQYQALLLKQVGRRVQMPAVNDPSVVRVYAHRRAPRVGAAPADHTATIYWHPVLVMPDGKAEVKFDLTDAGRFQVLIHSHTFDGRLGTNRADIPVVNKRSDPAK
jgi:hypothetical protein